MTPNDDGMGDAGAGAAGPCFSPAPRPAEVKDGASGRLLASTLFSMSELPAVAVP